MRDYTRISLQLLKHLNVLAGNKLQKIEQLAHNVHEINSIVNGKAKISAPVRSAALQPMIYSNLLLRQRFFLSSGKTQTNRDRLYYSYNLLNKAFDFGIPTLDFWSENSISDELAKVRTNLATCLFLTNSPFTFQAFIFRLPIVVSQYV